MWICNKPIKTLAVSTAQANKTINVEFCDNFMAIKITPDYICNVYTLELQLFRM